MKPTAEDCQASTPQQLDAESFLKGNVGVHLVWQGYIPGDFYSLIFLVTDFSSTLSMLLLSPSLLLFLLLFPLYNDSHFNTKISFFYIVSWFCIMKSPPSFFIGMLVMLIIIFSLLFLLALFFSFCCFLILGLAFTCLVTLAYKLMFTVECNFRPTADSPKGRSIY